MIYSYKIANFRSIKLEVEIKFKASPLKLHTDHLMKNKIIPTISIFGPNGGGKTCVIQSMLELRNIVTKGNDVQQLGMNLKKLKNFEMKDKPIKWTINFINKDGEIYKYTLHFTDHISHEKLSYFKKNRNAEEIIFEREKNKLIEACDEIKNSKIKFDNVISTYLYYISNILDIDSITFIMSEFKKMISFNTLNPTYGFGGLDYSFINRHKKDFIKIFEDVDINILDFKITEHPNSNVSFDIVKEASWGGKINLPFSEESKGTQKFIQLLSYILKNLYNGSYFLIDELDSSLHTKLLGYVIKIFQKSKTGSQLIFTSHDIGTLSSEYFRKDEIYFAALNESKFTNLISLNDFDNLQIRDKSSFANIYLSGKIGYDPYIDLGMEWIKNENTKK